MRFLEVLCSIHRSGISFAFVYEVSLDRMVTHGSLPIFCSLVVKLDNLERAEVWKKSGIAYRQSIFALAWHFTAYAGLVSKSLGSNSMTQDM
jgi:hypothetical protein